MPNKPNTTSQISLTTITILIVTIIAVASIVVPIFLLKWPTSKEDLQPFSDVFTGISTPIISLATLLATVVIAIELSRIEKKNRDADKGKEYLPQMVAEQLFFYCYNSIHQNIQVPTEYTYIKKDEGYRSHSPSLEKFVINIHNIGLGAAKNLEFQFNYDIDELSRLIKRLYTENINEEPFEIQKQAFREHSAIHFKYPTNWRMPETSYYLGIEENFKHTHLLNASISQTPYQCRIPRLLLIFHSIFLYICFKRLDRNKKPSFPPFNLNIIYEDIAGTKRQTILQITFEAILFGTWYLNELKVTQLSDKRIK